MLKIIGLKQFNVKVNNLLVMEAQCNLNIYELEWKCK